MCGIVSILRFRGQLDPNRLDGAVEALKHRGPDGRGSWTSLDRTVALGHTRLAVRGINSGAQPMHHIDGGLVAVVSGELYPYRELRSELEGSGHRFRTNSDSELVLHLYREQGLDFVHSLKGEFALVLWDRTRKRLVAVRDPFGIRPLCFARTNDELVLASEGKAILAAGHPGRWNRSSFLHAAGLQYLPPRGTIFEGIEQLPPGSMMTVADGQIETTRYFELSSMRSIRDGAQNASHHETYRAAFDRAVEVRLDSEAPVAFGLSGGIDSSSIVASAKTMMTDAPTCFSVFFGEESHDESPIVREFAASQELSLRPVSFEPSDFVRYMPASVVASETFSVNAHAAAKYKLAEAVRAEGFKVLLTGEGADEFLLGYPHFKVDLGIEPSAHSTHVTSGILLPHGPSLDTRAFETALGFVPAFIRTKAGFGHRIAALLEDTEAESLRSGETYGVAIAGLHLGSDSVPPVLRSMLLWSQLSLPNYLMKIMGDGQEMANAVEGRLPFLDVDLVRLTLGLPLDQRIRAGREKYVLREAMRERLTPTLYGREKHPFFAPPIDTNANAEVHDYINDTLRGEGIRSMPFLSSQKVIAWLDRPPALDPRNDATLCFLLSVAALADGFSLS